MGFRLGVRPHRKPRRRDRTRAVLGGGAGRGPRPDHCTGTTISSRPHSPDGRAVEHSDRRSSKQRESTAVHPRARDGGMPRAGLAVNGGSRSATRIAHKALRSSHLRPNVLAGVRTRAATIPEPEPACWRTSLIHLWGPTAGPVANRNTSTE